MDRSIDRSIDAETPALLAHLVTQASSVVRKERSVLARVCAMSCCTMRWFTELGWCFTSCAGGGICNGGGGGGGGKPTIHEPGGLIDLGGGREGGAARVPPYLCPSLPTYVCTWSERRAYRVTVSRAGLESARKVNSIWA